MYYLVLPQVCRNFDNYQNVKSSPIRCIRLAKRNELTVSSNWMWLLCKVFETDWQCSRKFYGGVESCPATSHWHFAGDPVYDSGPAFLNPVPDHNAVVLLYWICCVRQVAALFSAEFEISDRFQFYLVLIRLQHVSAFYSNWKTKALVNLG